MAVLGLGQGTDHLPSELTGPGGGGRKENEAVAPRMFIERLLCTEGQRRVSYSWSLPSVGFQFCGGHRILAKELQMACVFQKGR